MMHVKANCDYDITGFAYDQVIASFTNFVYLFMTVSAFGMCCGYYQRMLENKLNLADFYSKRFKKILPFFGALVLLDVVMSPSMDALYEAFAVSLIYNLVCASYFDVGRSNILYSACYFLAGGLIYLYRDKIERVNRWVGLGIMVISIILYYVVGAKTGTMLLVSAAMLSYAVIYVGGYRAEQAIKQQEHYFGKQSH